MNRKQKRLKEKLARRANKKFSEVEYSADEWSLPSYKYSKPKEEPKEPEIPGVNVRPIDLEYEAKINRNSWHDLSELTEFIETIKKLASEDDPENNWSWARNWNCKYVDIRIDMRDGGFVLKDREGNRINLDQLKWQYRSPKESQL